jgi:hypothetical protein
MLFDSTLHSPEIGIEEAFIGSQDELKQWIDLPNGCVCCQTKFPISFLFFPFFSLPSLTHCAGMSCC